mgnify:CR=1 FL=1
MEIIRLDTLYIMLHFWIGDKNSDKAFLQYDYISSNKVDLYHTLVPPAYRGHGIAAILAEVSATMKDSEYSVSRSPNHS